ncbi:AAA family ATPase [Streptomyces tsukubensis]|uniref:Nuclease SbcCD subunit C n=1 Tax=Streptomyces tsukubensis TaxID=83656 RepID=A0A1V4A7M7_9ACTN|nr:SMC family ATPase [Streptomyces tsukubensis]OON77345.1 ATP-binding cassette family protein [Streptomyces tsukubensis]QFR92426.1 AAA family ATPase [Streptomyces tsukubensis]
MRLHRLRISAFGPFAGEQEIDFDELSGAGLFLLHGQTGAGKTSVLDAVCYALYGSLPGARQGQNATLRSDHAAPNVRTEVCLELTVAGRRLEITRQPPWERPKKRGHGTTTEKAQSWLREHDPVHGPRDLSRSHAETGEEITQLLGMSKEQFCQVVLLPQGDFARFLRADAEARGKLLGRLFDTRRFAAVEQRLAELRRRSEAEVREGDDRLLAMAHRMSQAAGDGVELPLPDASPGDPGLAGRVLEWAAVARAGAREHLTGAEIRRAEARAGLADVRRSLDGVRELHRLQQRAAEAAGRAATLEARSEEHRHDLNRMERARKAAAVAPALGLYDAATSEHRAATAAEERARAALPHAHADAGAAGLSAAARAALEELGGLESARRAERRLTALAGERAELARQEGADEEVQQEATGWLDGWEERRAALQDRVESAQEAATRAEHLAGRLEPATRKLTSARRRDTLAADTERAERTLLDARQRAGDAHERWLALKEQRLLGIAAELAAGLTEGEPCAVCGATEHPAPTRRDTDHVDRAAEETALTVHQEAERDRSAAEGQLASLRAALTAARDEAGDEPAGRLAAHVEEVRAGHAEARSLAAGLHAAREALARAEREHQHRLGVRQETATRATSRSTARDALDRERVTLEEELAQGRGELGSVAARTSQLERRAALLTDGAEAARAAQDTAERLKKADAALADAAFRAGFDTPDAASVALLDDSAHRALQHRIDAWQHEETAVRAVLAEPDTADAAGRPSADPEGARRRAAHAERRADDAVAAHDRAARRCVELDRLSEEATSEARALGPLRTEYERVAGLAGLAAGTSADNDRKMRLESYVLAARLEQVAAAASVRLRSMSGHRYTLVHSDGRSGRGRSGLGLHVVDAWTGRERDTATLSGGETFFASLALALGLADVVTDEAGGVRLDTLFIDEGFGSLDDQTLDEVLDVLDSLRERDRSVGIVSHVADLRRRVHAQLEVVKGRSGSVVRQAVRG